MRLNQAQVERTLNQFEAQALPDNHPAIAQLSDLFGDHTFFIDSTGLHLFLRSPQGIGVHRRRARYLSERETLDPR